MYVFLVLFHKNKGNIFYSDSFKIIFQDQNRSQILPEMIMAAFSLIPWEEMIQLKHVFTQLLSYSTSGQ